MPEDLLLYDVTDAAIAASAAEVGALWKIDKKRQRQMEDLDDLAKKIRAFKRLDTLVIYTHGIEGGILLAGKAYNLSDKEISDALAKVSTVVDHIRFEGCHVGVDPLEMAAFGRLLKATHVSGFTWAHYSGSVEVTIKKGSSKSDLKTLDVYKKWITPGTPTIEAIATKARTRDIKWTFLTEWYQFHLEPLSFAPYIDNNYSKYGRMTYKVRADAEKITVDVKDAKRSDSPVPPFQYVTVKLQ